MARTLNSENFRIGNRTIGPDTPPYIIAEMSCNHDGDKEKALQLVKVASECGADAIKLQTYTPDTMTIDCKNKEFTINEGLWSGKTLYELYQKAHTPWHWTTDLFALAETLKIDIFSSPFDETAVEFLEKFDPPAYKIASLEITDTVLLKAVARTGKPIILSTGTSSLGEIEFALNALYDYGAQQVALLHCISGYPTPVEEINLSAIPFLRETFKVPIGLSDHTQSSLAASGAIALGARIVEKHLVLDKNDGSLDSEFSLDPDEFSNLVKNCNIMYNALGRSNHDLAPSERETRNYRRSIYVVENIKRGERLSTKNIRRIRPGYGMACKYYEEIMGKTVNKDLHRGAPLSHEDIN